MNVMAYVGTAYCRAHHIRVCEVTAQFGVNEFNGHSIDKAHACMA